MKTCSRQIKLTTALLLIAALSFVSVGYGPCSQSEKDRNIAIARDINGAFKAGCPVVKRSKPSLGARCDQGVEISGKLIEAFAANDQASIAALIADVLPVFTDVVDQFTDNDNVLGYFALGQIGLNFLINHFLTRVVKAPLRTSGASADDDSRGVLDRFRALPQFGCRLHPEKCK